MLEMVKQTFDLYHKSLRTVYYLFGEEEGLQFQAHEEEGFTAHDGSEEAWAVFEAQLVLYYFNVGIDVTASDGDDDIADN
jgi:hypothetical protein